jgi:transcriptional regulator with XRE-family HTH domain
MSKKMPLLENFRHNLARKIEQSGTSKTAIAERAGIHRVTLHKLLAGGIEPSLDMCEKLAAALGFSDPGDIFKKSRRATKKTA